MRSLLVIAMLAAPIPCYAQSPEVQQLQAEIVQLKQNLASFTLQFQAMQSCRASLDVCTSGISTISLSLGSAITKMNNICHAVGIYPPAQDPIQPTTQP